MVAKIHTPQHSDYLSAGSLRRPLLLGRLLRFVLGILCLSLAWDSFDSSDSAAVSSASWWLAVVLGLLLVNYVVNFGFGLQLKSVPVVASLVLLGGSAAYSQYELGTVLGEPLFSLSRIWLIYVFTHLGASFLIAATIATPGCEMRAIPHLIGSMRQIDVSEHACPALIDKLDEWEHHYRNGGGPQSDSESATSSRDLLLHPAGYLGLYGIPFLALQLAGNMGGFATATLVPALAFLFTSILSLVNVIRCRRTHSMLLAPLLMLAAILMGLYRYRLLNFGPDTWAIIVNGTIIIAVCFSIKLEVILGRYLGAMNK